MFQYKVLLPTSGTGSRLGEITKHTNKALVLLNGREAVRYILDSYDDAVPFVVTLGYLGEAVKTFLTKNYPQRVFEFVWVDTYEGQGSSLGYSMLQARANLQCPFIFHACDGIFFEKIPSPERNWIGGYVPNQIVNPLPIEHYRTHTIKNAKILRLNDRGIVADSIHIGLDGIRDYKMWWRTLEEIYNRDKNDAQISDVPVLDSMIKQDVEFDWVPYKIWLDTGNVAAFQKACEYVRVSAKNR